MIVIHKKLNAQKLKMLTGLIDKDFNRLLHHPNLESLLLTL